MNENLFDKNVYSDELQKDIEKYGSPEIGFHIINNLKNELRDYQKRALKHYLQNEKIQNSKRHLMFNMATGSGKTMIMAALMLECFKKGYRNFVFFVNSSAVLEKTKINFTDKNSNKYLFVNQIIINSKRVEINILQNLNESKENCINIYFNTIQGLFSLFTQERENSITLSDLKGKKLVFLADEAHHLNADTKSQKDDERSWESVMKNAFNSNYENLMYEFSATIPKDLNVLEKYKDKIVFKYDLKSFCNEGFSKRIFLSKYENKAIENRFLGSVLLSVYREILANKNKIYLKPIVLFKSQTVKSSKDNKENFKNFLANLTAKKIDEFYNLSQNNDMFLQSKNYFKEIYGEKYAEILVNLIQNSFKDEFLLDVNEEKDKVNNQILLNSLEDKNNLIRAIFAVDKLNEGWDVLNLFDIVRLDSGDKKSVATTKEAQLIGRGARYFPFGENKFKRKFDDDLKNPLNMLERLSYHTTNDVEYIANLNKSMQENGLFVELQEQKIILKPTKKANEITDKFDIFYLSNQRRKKDVNSLFASFEKEKIKHEIMSLNIGLFSDEIINKDIFDKENASLDTKFKNSKKLKDNIKFAIFQKAFNKTGLKFDKISANFGVKSRFEFYEYLSNFDFLFDENQIFNAKNSLSICEFILKNLQNLITKKQDEYEVSDFVIKKLEKSNFKNRVIFKQNCKINDAREWMYYDKYSFDSQLENKFIEFIEARKIQIDAIFKEWIIFRNDGFKEFKIYDNRIINGEKSPTYGIGFEPDFVFFGIKKDEYQKCLADEKSKINKPFLTNEYIFEPKGEHLSGENGQIGIDDWKEKLLDFLSKDYKNVKVVGFPFFNEKNGAVKREFLQKFDKILK